MVFLSRTIPAKEARHDGAVTVLRNELCSGGRRDDGERRCAWCAVERRDEDRRRARSVVGRASILLVEQCGSREIEQSAQGVIFVFEFSERSDETSMTLASEHHAPIEQSGE